MIDLNKTVTFHKCNNTKLTTMNLIKNTTTPVVYPKYLTKLLT